MNGSLWLEYLDLVGRYKKLIHEERKLQTDHVENVEDFLNSSLSDPEWEENLVETSCNLASSELRLEFAFNKILQIRGSLLEGEKEK